GHLLHLRRRVLPPPGQPRFPGHALLPAGRPPRLRLPAHEDRRGVRPGDGVEDGLRQPEPERSRGAEPAVPELAAALVAAFPGRARAPHPPGLPPPPPPAARLPDAPPHAPALRRPVRQRLAAAPPARPRPAGRRPAPPLLQPRRQGLRLLHLRPRELPRRQR